MRSHRSPPILRIPILMEMCEFISTRGNNAQRGSSALAEKSNVNKARATSPAKANVLSLSLSLSLSLARARAPFIRRSSVTHIYQRRSSAIAQRLTNTGDI
jgi:hypothetical protein